MDFIDIENGKLFRFEGWDLKEDNFELDSYRSSDENWEYIQFEGYFVEPHGDIDLHKGLDYRGWVSDQVAFREKEGFFTNNNDEYILFLAPQDCDSLIAGENYPQDKTDWSVEESGESDGQIQVFICKNGKILPLSFYKTMPMMGMSWDEALKNNPKWFIN